MKFSKIKIIREVTPNPNGVEEDANSNRFFQLF